VICSIYLIWKLGLLVGVIGQQGCLILLGTCLQTFAAIYIVVWFPISHNSIRAVQTVLRELSCAEWNQTTINMTAKFFEQTELSTFFSRNYLKRSITNWGRKYILKQ
jgi:hypothetical protein